MKKTGQLPFEHTPSSSPSKRGRKSISPPFEGGARGGLKKGVSTSKFVQLSPSTISLYKECKRCFWLQLKQGIYKPRGIFPSLPGGMDSVIKVYYDKFRGTKTGLPPELVGKVNGKLYDDQRLLSSWRSRTGGLTYFDDKLNAKLLGLLDDCLVIDEGGPSASPSGLRSGQVARSYVPLDYKTRGWEPKEDSSDFYQHQLDIYEFLLQANGMATKGLGYLVYYHPIEVRENGVVQFEVTPKAMKTDPQRAKKLFEEAVKLLRSDEIPKPSAKCEFCPWGQRQGEYA